MADRLLCTEGVTRRLAKTLVADTEAVVGYRRRLLSARHAFIEATHIEWHEEEIQDPANPTEVQSPGGNQPMDEALQVEVVRGHDGDAPKPQQVTCEHALSRLKKSGETSNSISAATAGLPPVKRLHNFRHMQQRATVAMQWMIPTHADMMSSELLKLNSKPSSSTRSHPSFEEAGPDDYNNNNSN
eukprot:CAMPEP_0115049232 /NCGR_PEP_ID=MMETSP0227-20121206/1066_1 /TAXON_ID=89957 /ORGANISM="Polarella glacialis, Strain CCMP 1383" /LENGTH=185 /DNA_ID=CAMNT_0002432857 /DNA_START=340 /DNA_END=897 /DNA_ORIENTATION=-